MIRMLLHHKKLYLSLTHHDLFLLTLFVLIFFIHTSTSFTSLIHHPTNRHIIINQLQSQLLQHNEHDRKVMTKLKLSSSQSDYHDNENDYKKQQRILNVIGDRISKNKNNKEINLELVSLGNQFDSFRRRFDYLSLIKMSNEVNTSGIHDDDDNNNCNNDDGLVSLWVRDDSQSINLQSFLEASRGLSSEDAKEELQKLHTQSYHRIQSNEVDMKGKYMFKVKTHNGLPVVDIDNISSQYDKKIYWEGDKYVTLLFHDDDNVHLRIEKYLSFSNQNHMTLTVNSTLYSHDDRTDFVECIEIFHPVYPNDLKNDGNESNYLRSPLERVPGCIANVKICTTLIPMSDKTSFGIVVDGESDTLLSRGLLAILSTALSSFDSNDVLNIDPYTVADELRLRSVLSAGRNDGLSNMVSIVQDQVRSLLHDTSEDKIITKRDTKANDKQKGHSNDRPTVAMLLSGGVDSAVALNLLLRQNYNVTAFYLKIWLEDELAHLGQCPWEDDYNVCMEVCKHAGGVPLEAISLQNEYKERVISYTINEAKRGFTPNPDIMCNSRIKFGCFYDAIAGRGFDYVASGHYAQLSKESNGNEDVMKLLRAPDPVKDQSYFLAALRQDQLKRVLFPIGHLQKSEVRSLAEEFDLPNKSRPDSQGLCFLGKVKFDEFLSAYLGKEPGDIIDAHTGDIIGRHNGIWYHTVGQRKGIGKVLDPKATSKGPWYVVAKDPNNRKIIASNQYDEDMFLETRSEFYVEDIKWIAGFEPLQLKSSNNNELICTMKIRHGPTIVNGVLRLDNPDTGTVSLSEKDGGLAPGQFVVFYEGTECIGSAVISEKHWLRFQAKELYTV